MHRHFSLGIVKIKNFSKIPTEIKKISVLFLFFVLFISLVEPFIPIYLNNIVGGFAGTGIIFSLFGIIMVFTDLPVSSFVGKFGSRFSMTIGMVVRTIAAILYGLFPSIGGLISARLVDGLSVPFTWDAARIKIRFLSPKKLHSESFSVFSIAVLIGGIIGTFVGTFVLMQIGLINISILFYVSAIGTMITAFFLKTTKKINHREKVNIRKMLHFNKKIYEPMIFALPIVTISTGLIMALPLFTESLGGSIFAIGMIAIFHRSPGLLQYKFAELGDKIGKKKIMFWLSVASIPLFILLFFVTSLILLFPIIFVQFLLLESMLVNNEGYSSDIFPVKHEDELTGAFQMSKHVGMIIGPLSMGIIAQFFGLNTVFLLSGGITAILAISLKLTN